MSSNKQEIEEMKSKGGWYLPNIQQDSNATVSSTTPQTTSTVEISSPEKTATTEVRTEYDAETKQGAQNDYDKSMAQQGYTKNEQGEWKPNNSFLSSVIDMKKHNEEVERVNKAKALNAGLYHALSTIGDMIAASGGGSVYKRDKDTIAADATKDTIARRDALIVAENNARAKDRESLMNAIKNAQAAYDKYLELNGVKKSQQTSVGGTETRTTTNSGGTTTQSTNTIKSGEATKFTPITVYSQDGRGRTMYVDRTMAAQYANQAWSDLTRIDLRNNKELRNYAESKGYIDGDGKWKPSLDSVILSDPEIFKALPSTTQQMNRELYFKSEEFGRYVNGADFNSMTEEQQKAERDRIYNSVYGAEDEGFNPNSKSVLS